MNSQVDTYLIERRVFECMLDTGETYDLQPEDFKTEEFELTWHAALACKQSLGKLDVVLLQDYIDTHAGIDRREWLQTVYKNRTYRSEMMPAYVSAMRAHLGKFDLRSTLSAMAAEAANEGDPVQLREKAITNLRALSLKRDDCVVTAKDALPDVINEIETRHTQGGLTGTTTGMATLDKLTGGWQRSDLAIIAARPAVGKTALMLNLALAAPGNIGIVSAEQPARQILLRMIAMAGRIPAWKLRNPREMTDEEWARLAPAVKKIGDLPITILDLAAPTISRVIAEAENMDVGLLLVDYVQRIRGEGEGIYERVSSVALGLKELARSKEIPVVALAQINRQGAQNAGMHHLKGSGDIEQEADLVLILSRQDETDETDATLTVEKNRHGPTGVVNLHFDGPTMIFTERA